jgi:hypothetical protein
MQDSPASRRKFFLGAGAAGAAAAAVAVLPKIEATDAVAAPERRAAPEKGGGYVLSEHVKRYYRTTAA